MQSAIDIKSWQQRLPTVDEARPSSCPMCGAASCPVGGRRRLQGHGLRERQVRGPREPTEAAVLVSISVRRYRCLSCGAVLVVVPCALRARRLYSASAIGLALALWGLLQMATSEVRRRMNPAKLMGNAAAVGWATLRRWARDARAGRLFPGAPKPGPGATLRQVAASVAAASAASAEASTRGLALEQRAFYGAAQAA